MKQANKNIFILIIIALSVFLTESAFAHSIPKWRFLIYMQADNNLYEYAKWDLLEIQSAIDPVNVEVIVRLDTPGDKGITDFKIQSQKTILPNSIQEVKNYKIQDLAMESLAYMDEMAFSSQSESLDDFIYRYSTRNQNQETALFIWGHGEGFSSERNAQFGGVALDDFPKQRMTIIELKNSLRLFESMSAKKLSLLAMDACLMQTLETAIEIKDEVEYFIGSTQIQNFRGLPYHLILEQINEDSSAFNLAKLIPKTFISESNRIGNSSATMSALNTHELANIFIDEFDDSFELITSYLKAYPFEKIAIKEKINESPFFLGNSRDLSTSLRLLQEYFYEKDEFTIYQSLGKSIETLNQSIISFGHGRDYFQENSEYFRGFFKAFGIWFPASSLEYQIKIDDFKRSKLYQSQEIKHWFDFLDQLHKKSFISF